MDSTFDERLNGARIARACFTSVVMKNRTGVLVLDVWGRVLFANPAAERALGRHHNALVGEMFGVPALGERTEIQIHRPTGEVGIAEVSSSVTEWNEAPAHLVMLYDITDRKAAEDVVRHMATHDELTGLPNRAAFQDRLQQALDRRGQDSRRLAVLFMDLDRFKSVNDTLGHHAGDELLQSLARRLPDQVRATDTVARLGGDEFVVLLEGVGDDLSTADLAERLLEATVDPVELRGQKVVVGACIGIAMCPEHGTDVNTLMRHADAAMYAAKRDPAQHVCFFVPGDDLEAARRLEIESSLQSALQNEEYLLHFQPQFEVETGDLVGTEALLRWQRPERGLVGPVEFISSLESTGQIVEVGQWVVRQACMHVLQWRSERLEPVPVSINVSPVQLSKSDFAEATLETISEYGLRPEDFAVEITESAIIENMPRAERVLRTFAEAGTSLHLDDFGTGYSSLNVLKRLPFDTLKIDRSFTADVVTDARSGALAESIIRMAHDLGMDCIAEGVENEAQLSFLRERGCDRIQGFLTGRPMPADQLERRLGSVGAGNTRG